MRRNAILAVVLACAALGACAIKQNVVPVSMEPRTEICIVRSTATRETFLAAYERALAQRGFAPRVLPVGSAINACPVTTTYVAQWSWDLGMYMSYAEITVFRDGAKIGGVVYDSALALGFTNRIKRLVHADKKIVELVGQLFPPEASSPDQVREAPEAEHS